MNNPKIPYNELPKLPPKFEFEDINILKKLGEAKEALAELRGISYLFDSNISYMLLIPLTTVEAVSSSNIENIHSTIEGSFQAEVLADSEINIPDKETRNYKRVFLFAIIFLRKDCLVLNIELLENI
jgi:Fic family protein